MRSRNVLIHHSRGRIDDAHVHTGFDGVEKEHGVHGFAYIIIATEGERKIAHSATHVSTGQVFTYPTCGFDKAACVIVVLTHACADGEYVGVEDDVASGEAHLFCQNAVGTLADADATFVSCGLSLLVEGHNHHGSPHATQFGGPCFENGFSLFQRQGIDNAFALHTFQGSTDNFPVGRVDHERAACHFRLGCQQVEEVHHLFAGVEQTFVHVDVDDLCSVFHLSACDGHSFVILFLFDKSQELARTCHVATFAHVDEIHVGLQLEQVKTGQLHVSGRGCRGMGWEECTVLLYDFGILGDVGICGAAASAYDVHKSGLDIVAHFLGHGFRCLVVTTVGIGKTGIGIHRNAIGSALSQFLNERTHFGCAKRAVQSHAENVGMRHRGKKSRERLSRKCSSGTVGYGHGEHDGHAACCALHGCFGSMQGCFGIERVENRFDEQGIHAFADKGFHLLDVGFGQGIECEGTQCRVVHIGTHGERLACGTHASGYQTRFLRSAPCVFGCQIFGQSHCRFVELATKILTVIFAHGDALCAEGVGLDDVGTGFKVSTVYVGNDVGARQGEQVVVSLLHTRQVGKACAAVVGFGEAVTLNHGAHGAIENEYALRR